MYYTRLLLFIYFMVLIGSVDVRFSSQTSMATLEASTVEAQGGVVNDDTGCW